MKPPRPYRRAAPDKNHSIVTKALKNWGGGFARDEFGVWQGHIHGLSVAAYDVSKLGGQLPDWIVAVSWLVIGFEVKEQRPLESNKGRKRELSDDEYYWSMLKPGEVAYFLHSPMLHFIVSSEEQVWAKLLYAVDFVEYVDGLVSVRLSEPCVNLFFPKLRGETDAERFERAFDLD